MFSTWLGVVLALRLLRSARARCHQALRRAATTTKRSAPKCASKKLKTAQKENLDGAHDLRMGRQEQRRCADPDQRRRCKLSWLNWPDKKPTAAGPIVAASPSAGPQTRQPPMRPRRLRRRAATPAAASVSTTPKPTSVAGTIPKLTTNPPLPRIPPPRRRRRSRDRIQVRPLAAVRRRQSARSSPSPIRLAVRAMERRCRFAAKRHESVIADESRRSSLESTSSDVTTPDNEVTTHDVEQVERALIDASTRLPVLFFYASGDYLAPARDASRRLYLVETARARFARELQLAHLGPDSSRAHERDGLWLGLDGRNRHRDLADGAIVPDDVAPSVAPHRGRRVLESRRAYSASAESWPATAPATNGSSFRPMRRSFFSSPIRSSFPGRC